jgi:hypothetical protein
VARGIFVVPDTVPLSPSDLAAANRRHAVFAFLTPHDVTENGLGKFANAGICWQCLAREYGDDTISTPGEGRRTMLFYIKRHLWLEVTVTILLASLGLWGMRALNLPLHLSPSPLDVVLGVVGAAWLIIHLDRCLAAAMFTAVDWAKQNIEDFEPKTSSGMCGAHVTTTANGNALCDYHLRLKTSGLACVWGHDNGGQGLFCGEQVYKDNLCEQHYANC